MKGEPQTTVVTLGDRSIVRSSVLYGLRPSISAGLMRRMAWRLVPLFLAILIAAIAALSGASWSEFLLCGLFLAFAFVINLLLVINACNQSVGVPLLRLAQELEQLALGEQTDLSSNIQETEEFWRLAEALRYFNLRLDERDAQSAARRAALEEEIRSRTEDLRSSLRQSEHARGQIIGQRRILEKIALGAPLSDTLENVARQIEASLSQAMALCFTVNTNGLSLLASPSITVSQRQVLIKHANDDEAPWKVCATRREVLVFEDLLKSDNSQEWITDLYATGIRAVFIHPIFSSNREVLGILAVCYEFMHEPDTFEKELIEALCSIAGIAIERSQSEGRLIEAREVAERATTAKSEFLANVSHEIRTPLNGVIGMTDLVLESGLTGEQRTYLELVKDSSHHLLQVVNDILDLSKIESGKLTLAPEAVEIERVLLNTMALQSMRADGKGLEFVSFIHKNVPSRLVLDSLRLGQVLHNLASNAIKFTSFHGAVLLYCEASNISDSEIELHLVVSDTGIGIPAEKQELIFEAFAQADASTTRRYGGTGLGLTICRKLVALMGGKMWVNSRVGIGSAFHFTVKASQLAAGLGTSSRPSSGAWRRPVLSLATPEDVSRTHIKPGSIKVLLVEDNLINQKLASKLLESRGYQVKVASNGKLAVETLAKESFDIVLMDCQMPVMDGYEATRLIRKGEKEQGESRHIPVVAMTAHAMAGDKEKCLQVGMDEYLTKPIIKESLFDVISRLTLAN